jgi:hypothetical protein
LICWLAWRVFAGLPSRWRERSPPDRIQIRKRLRI